MKHRPVTARDLNKELRPLFWLAEEQGWRVEALENNHLRWIPPRGPFIHSSSRVNTQVVIKIIRRDLIRGGLRMEALKSQRAADFVNTLCEHGYRLDQLATGVAVCKACDAVAEDAEPLGATVKALLPNAARATGGVYTNGSHGEVAVLTAKEPPVRVAAERAFGLHQERVLKMAMIFERVKVFAPKATYAALVKVMMDLQAKRRVERVGRGMYRWIGELPSVTKFVGEAYTPATPVPVPPPTELEELQAEIDLLGITPEPPPAVEPPAAAVEPVMTDTAAILKLVTPPAPPPRTYADTLKIPPAATVALGPVETDTDLKELDDALEALARIEAVVRKHRKVLIQLRAFKALLNSTEGI